MRPRPVPDDFLEHAINEGQSVLAARYRVDASRIHYWLQQQPKEWLDKRFRNLRLRPAPADLAQRYQSMKRDELMEFYRCGDSTLSRWLKEANIKRKPSYFARNKRDLPDNLMELAQGKNVEQLAKIIGMNAEHFARRLKREAPDVHAYCKSINSKAKPVPADFDELGIDMPIRRLAAHYRTSDITVKRWCSMMPLEWQERRRIAVAARTSASAAAALAKARASGRMRQRSNLALMPQTSGDVASQAAHHLRRYYSNVFNVGKVYGKKALEGVYVVGKLRLDRDAMIALAEERGFDAGAWRRVAA